MFEWRDSYSVHVAAIDRDHQRLFAMLKELDEALAAGNGQTVIGLILLKLMDYTEQHFLHEERLMETHNFPGLEAHRAEHRAAREKVQKLESDYKLGKQTIPVSLLLFLEEWLRKHIAKSDMEYCSFLNERGVY